MELVRRYVPNASSSKKRIAMVTSSYVTLNMLMTSRRFWQMYPKFHIDTRISGIILYPHEKRETFKFIFNTKMLERAIIFALI